VFTHQAAAFLRETSLWPPNKKKKKKKNNNNNNNKQTNKDELQNSDMRSVPDLKSCDIYKGFLGSE